jgi:hypothetical protein
MSTSHDPADARPRTASPPTGDLERERWLDDEEEDDDPGMFSFLAPTTATTDVTPASASTSAPLSPNTASSAQPFTPDMFNRAPNPRSPQPAVSSAPEPPVLSPAAAYALAAQTEIIQEGTRRRGSWHNPDTPDVVVGNPYEIGLRGEDPRRVSDGSSRITDKVEPYLARWEDQGGSEASSTYGYGPDGHAIRLQELGGPIMPTRSQDEKMILEHGGGMGGYGGPFDYELEDDEDSPFPEVRASVSNIDDPDMPCLTFRTWFLGFFFAIVVTAINVFFYFRYPAPFITPILVQVLAYPCGKFLAWLLPATSWRLPKWMTRIGLGDDISFNPGPFNIKEHTVLVIIANIATGPAFALNFTVAAEKFYNITLGPGFDILLLLTTQMIGFGIAGLCRRFLVWPAAMIWPQNLVFCTLLNTLHAEDDNVEEGAGLSRFRFFTYVFGGAFFWYFLPGEPSLVCLRVETAALTPVFVM